MESAPNKENSFILKIEMFLRSLDFCHAQDRPDWRPCTEYEDVANCHNKQALAGHAYKCFEIRYWIIYWYLH
jgi:hypothetical protein